jgi:hypothetical protein
VNDNFKEFLCVLLTPALWIHNYSYDKHCDKWCREALKNPVITDVDNFRAYINGKQIWIANGYFALHFEQVNVRPSRYVTYRIARLVAKLVPGETKGYFQ